MAVKHYRSAELVFGWSFYRQGSSGGTSSADEFLDAALTWFGDPDPKLGTAWEKGERLAKLITIVEPCWFWMAQYCPLVFIVLYPLMKVLGIFLR
jgi:hypothetical protein